MTKHDHSTTDSDSDGGRDELADSPMPDAPDYTQGVAMDQSRASTEAVVGSKVKDMASEYDSKAKDGKLQDPTRFPGSLRIPHPEQQQESKSWMRSGVSLLKSVVSPQREIADSQAERDEVYLAEMESQIEGLQEKLRLKGEQIVKQDRSYAKERQRLDTKAEDHYVCSKLRHEKEWKGVYLEHEVELQTQKIHHEREAATKKTKHEEQLNKLKHGAMNKIKAAISEAEFARNETSTLQRTCREYEEKLKEQEVTIGRM